MTLSSNIRLSLVNSMLRTIGTAKLSASDTEHPDYITANDVLQEVIDDFSSMPLWFNTSQRILSKDTDGRVPIPNNTIAIDPVLGSLNYVARDRYLFDVNKRTNIIGQDVECFIQTKLELSDMPAEAIKFIRAEARYKFYLDEDGGERKVREYAGAAYDAKLKLFTVNMSRQDVNFFNGRSGRSFFTPRPAGYQHIGGGVSIGGVNFTQ